MASGSSTPKRCLARRKGIDPAARARCQVRGDPRALTRRPAVDIRRKEANSDEGLPFFARRRAAGRRGLFPPQCALPSTAARGADRAAWHLDWGANYSRQQADALWIGLRRCLASVEKRIP